MTAAKLKANSNWPKRYLGDGVYAASDGWYIWIWISNGIDDGVPMALETPVLGRLAEFARQEGIAR